MKKLSRQAERERSARFLNSLSTEELWKGFGISRVYEIGGFDRIGIPVWASTRPLSASISINSGKGINTMMARAGTIAESIEFAYAERPNPAARQRTIKQMNRWRDLEVIGPDKWHLAKGAFVNERSVFDWDVVARIQEPDKWAYLLPSEAVYIAEVTTGHLMRFQASTNGWATGASREDAILQALYEVVERDGWTLWNGRMEQHQMKPPRIDFAFFKEWQWFNEMVNRFDEQLLKLYLFDISTDTLLPIVWAVLCDLNLKPAGAFGGYGCSGTMEAAVTRATLEAVQSRACYIAGARDDLLRRNFLLMKSFNQKQATAFFDTLPSKGLLIGPVSSQNLTAKEELDIVLASLSDRGFSEFYVRDCGMPFQNNPFSVVKVYAPCLEQYKCGYYTPGKRAQEFYARHAV